MKSHTLRPEALSLGQTKARPAPWMLVVLLASGVAAAATGQFVWNTYALLDTAQRQHEEDQKRLNRQKTLQRQLQLQEANPAVLARRKAVQSLYDRQHLSWEGLFDCLETAVDKVDGGVSLQTVVPTVGSDTMEVRITALALNETFMLAWMAALRSDRRVRSMEPTTQQVDEKSAIPGAVQFQAVMTLDPAVEVVHPLRSLFVPAPLPPAPTTTSAAAPMPIGGRK